MATKNLSSALPLSGGTLTGNLILPNGYVPVNSLDIAPKSYLSTVAPTAATKADEIAGVNYNFISPLMMKHHRGACKAYGLTGLVNGIFVVANYGFSSTTSYGVTGVYKYNFTTPMASTNYTVMCSLPRYARCFIYEKTTAYVALMLVESTNGTPQNFGYTNYGYEHMSVAVWGDV